MVGASLQRRHVRLPPAPAPHAAKSAVVKIEVMLPSYPLQVSVCCYVPTDNTMLMFLFRDEVLP